MGKEAKAKASLASPARGPEDSIGLMVEIGRGEAMEEAEVVTEEVAVEAAAEIVVAPDKVVADVPVGIAGKNLQSSFIRSRLIF